MDITMNEKAVGLVLIELTLYHGLFSAVIPGRGACSPSCPLWGTLKATLALTTFQVQLISEAS